MQKEKNHLNSLVFHIFLAFDILLVLKLHNAHPPKPTQHHIDDSYYSRKKHIKNKQRKNQCQVLSKSQLTIINVVEHDLQKNKTKKET
jgi:hypothetical protein